MLCTKSHLYVAEVTKSHISVFYESNYIFNAFSTNLN